MAEIARERREEMRRITEHYGADRDDVIWHVCMAELSALLDAADERDRLREGERLDPMCAYIIIPLTGLPSGRMPKAPGGMVKGNLALAYAMFLRLTSDKAWVAEMMEWFAETMKQRVPEKH